MIGWRLQGGWSKANTTERHDFRDAQRAQSSSELSRSSALGTNINARLRGGRQLGPIVCQGRNNVNTGAGAGLRAGWHDHARLASVTEV